MGFCSAVTAVHILRTFNPFNWLDRGLFWTESIPIFDGNNLLDAKPEIPVAVSSMLIVFDRKWLNQGQRRGGYTLSQCQGYLESRGRSAESSAKFKWADHASASKTRIWSSPKH